MSGGARCDARGVGTLLRRVWPRSTLARAGWLAEAEVAVFCLNVGLRIRELPRASFWDFGWSGDKRRRVRRQTSHISHQRNASQIPRTEGACKSIAAIGSSTWKYRTDRIRRRKHDRTGQSTTSTTSRASGPLRPHAKPSSSRNGLLKLSLAPITTLTSVRDNGHACSIADCPPCKRWTSDIWLATTAASRRLAVDLDCSRHRRAACIPRDLCKDRQYVVGPGPRHLICKWLSTHWSGDSTRRYSERCSQAQVSKRGSLWCTDRSRSTARR